MRPTRWNRVIDEAGSRPGAGRRAFREMSSGRPDAARPGLPLDVQRPPVDPEQIWGDERLGPRPSRRQAPEPGAIDAAAAVIGGGQGFARCRAGGGWAMALLVDAISAGARRAGGCLVVGFVFTGQVLAQVVSETSGALPRNGGEYRITEDLGLVRGPNLFHGLTRFDLAAGETARFTGPSAIDNIVTRVSGGTPSSIDGTLHTRDYAGANLYLFNPSGVSIGPNGRLEVDGDFHLSSADAVRLADGTGFGMDTSLAADSPLTVAPPAAFHFFGAGPADISVTGSILTVPAGSSLSIVGGDLALAGATLTAEGGRIVLASVGSAGATRGPAPGAGAPDLADFARLGDVTIDGGLVDSSGAGGGAVAIRGGRLIARGEAGVFAAVISDRTPPADAGIDVRVRGDLRLEGGAVFGTIPLTGVSTPSGGVRLEGQKVEIVGAPTRIFSNNSGSGRSGDIRLRGDEVVIRDGGSVQMRTLSNSTGRSGDIVIEAHRRAAVENGGLVFTLTFGSPDAGNLRLEAPDAHVTSEAIPGTFTGVLSQSAGTGAAGDVTVRAGRLDVLAGAELSSSTFGPGAAGDIDIAPLADRLEVRVSGAPGTFGGIFANTRGSGPGGTVRLRASDLVVEKRGSLQAQSLASGAAGGVRINVSGRVTVADRGFITAGALFGTGAGGDLLVQADELRVIGISESRDFFDPSDFTGLSAATNVGAGGDLEVRVAHLDVRDKGAITTNSAGPGAAGDISIQVSEQAIVSNGGEVLALALGAGAGGDIEFRGPSLRVVGVNPHPTDIAIGEFLAPSAISTQTQSPTADAGNIRIVAGHVEVAGGAQIDSQTFGAGDGGTVEIQAGTVRVLGRSDAQLALTGNATAARSKISSSTDSSVFGASATGAGGTVRIVADAVEVAGGEVSAVTATPGRGGAVLVEADTVELSTAAG